MEQQKIKIFVLAGESSGDQMAAKVISDIRQKYDVELHGIGGESLQSIGLQSLFPMQELSLMGVFEILPHLGNLLARIQQTIEAIIAFQPDFVLSFDSPDFCFRVLKKYKKQSLKRGISNPAKLIHFVAPTVWAWRAGRAKKIAKFLNYLFCLFPFEPPYFKQEGLPASYMKHPFIAGYKSKKLFDWKKQQGLDKKNRLIGIFPGSRKGEIERMFPVLWSATKEIYKKNPETRFVVLTLSHLEPLIQSLMEKNGLPVTITTDKENKESILSSCDYALATSGTIGFELSLAKVPHVIAYKMSAITAMIARRLVKTPYIHLLNIHLKEQIIPEIIQEQCTGGRLARELLQIMEDEKRQSRQKQAFDRLLDMLEQDKDYAQPVDVIDSFLQNRKHIQTV